MNVGCYLFFLSDPSPTIVYPCQSVINSHTDSCFVDLTDVTLAFEDANSKLLDVVSVADVDAEERVDLSLVAILKLRFGRDLTLIPQY